MALAHAAAPRLPIGQSAGTPRLPTGHPPEDNPDYLLRIAPVTVELDRSHILSTVGYNGAAPGPLFRLRAGRRVGIDVVNDVNPDPSPGTQAKEGAGCGTVVPDGGENMGAVEFHGDGGNAKQVIGVVFGGMARGQPWSAGRLADRQPRRRGVSQSHAAEFEETAPIQSNAAP